jgi:hypothetical protein
VSFDQLHGRKAGGGSVNLRNGKRFVDFSWSCRVGEDRVKRYVIFPRDEKKEYGYSEDGKSSISEEFDIVSLSEFTPNNPQITKTVVWELSDYMEHADCWYKWRDIRVLPSRITGFHLKKEQIKLDGGWHYLDYDYYYCDTPNGEFLPCVKEVTVW